MVVKYDSASSGASYHFMQRQICKQASEAAVEHVSSFILNVDYIIVGIPWTNFKDSASPSVAKQHCLSSNV